MCRRSSQSSQCGPSVCLITLPNQLLGQWIYLRVDRQQCSGLPSSLGSGKGHFRPKCFLFNGEDTPRCCALSEHQTRQFFLVILLPLLLCWAGTVELFHCRSLAFELSGSPHVTGKYSVLRIGFSNQRSLRRTEPH